MRSASAYLPPLSQLSSALNRSLAAAAGRSAPLARVAPPTVQTAPAHTAKSGDSATWSSAGQALLDQPETQRKQVLSLLKTMFGITDVASMALDIDVSHEHRSQAASQEVLQDTGRGLSYSYQDLSLEAETTALHASGTITLADGRSFALDLDYQHSLTVTQSRSFAFASDGPGGSGPDGSGPNGSGPDGSGPGGSGPDGSGPDGSGPVHGPGHPPPPDLHGTGRRLLDQLFPPGDLTKNLGDILRELGSAHPPMDPGTRPDLRAHIEVSPLSTAALNAVFGRARDQLQQRQAELFQAPPGIRPQVDVQG